MMKLEELKKLAEAATPGPWRFSRESWNVSTPDCDTDIGIYIPESEENMTGEFIAAANPQTVLALIGENAGLRTELKRKLDHACMAEDVEARFADEFKVKYEATLNKGLNFSVEALAANEVVIDAYRELDKKHCARISALKNELEEARRNTLDLISLIPRTPQQMIDFIGSNFNCMQTHTEDGSTALSTDAVCYSITVHDLLSAFEWAGLHESATYPSTTATKQTDKSGQSSDWQQ
jgi:hypothetical protein